MKQQDSKKIIEKLVLKFKDHIHDYKQIYYKGAQLRIDFLNKFFKTLGWDIDNEKNLPLALREVKTEDSLEIEGRSKAPDYSFRLGNGKKQFFVEAKKPSINLKTHSQSSFQLRRYGWSADIGISILTNFEYFAVYDCSKKPDENQKASFARLKLIHFEEYVKNFDYLWSMFSRDAVFDGSLNKTKSKKGSLLVDDDFLKSLDRLRSELAKNIFKRNNIANFELNNCVQKIIDRIIFLRIAEDRDIEHYGSLLKISKSDNVFNGLLNLCRLAEDKYNSELFLTDSVLRNLLVDDSQLRSIVEELYFPKSPYEFSVLPIDILGKAYEQFLGKEIVIDKDGKLQITYKEEVKKAGGVYYTPKYIVDSIVEDTLGKLIKGKTPNEVEKIKILDPACGSGTFLLGAFEYLLNWYRNYYTNNKSTVNKKKYQIITPDGELTTKFKKKILLDNIYGVDVDRNAVEVTRLSLLLECLEGETRSSLEAQISMFNERVLPTLDKNISSGNSLIDFDIYALSPSLEEDLKIKRKINAFNWETTFKSVFRNGGFDVIIGNPPYVRQELFKEIKPYLEQKYEVYNGMADIYVYFIEKSYSLLRKSGIFSIIVSNKWFRAGYAKELRNWLKTVKLEYIKDFGGLSVFKSGTCPCIILIKKAKAVKKFDFIDLVKQRIKHPENHIYAKPIKIEMSNLSDSGWLLTDPLTLNILDKISKCSVNLDLYIDNQCYRGVLTGKNKVFIIDELTRGKLIEADSSSHQIIKPLVKGEDIKAYQKLAPKRYLIFTRRGINIDKYPAVKSYLAQYKDILKPKPKDWKSKDGEKWPGRKPGTYKWYEIQDSTDYYEKFDKNKIIYPEICNRPQFTFDDKGVYTDKTCFIIIKEDLFLLGVLNSELCHFWLEQRVAQINTSVYNINYATFKNFPVVKIDDNNLEMKALKLKIINCVKKLLNLHKKDNTQEVHREISFYKDKIDKLVYKVYGLKESQSKYISEVIENVRK